MFELIIFLLLSACENNHAMICDCLWYDLYIFFLNLSVQCDIFITESCSCHSFSNNEDKCKDNSMCKKGHAVCLIDYLSKY